MVMKVLQEAQNTQLDAIEAHSCAGLIHEF